MRISTNYDNVYVTNVNSGLTTVTNLDGGGAEFELSNCKFAGGSLQAISNITITNTTCTSLFNNCKSLEAVQVDLPNCVSAGTMFGGCSNVTGITATMPSLVNSTNIFSQCTSLKNVVLDLRSFTSSTNLPRLFLGINTLEHVELIVKRSMSRYVEEQLKQNISSTPAGHGWTYVDDIDATLYRVTFTIHARPEEYYWEDYVFALAIKNPNTEQIGTFTTAMFNDNDATLHVTAKDYIDNNIFDLSKYDSDSSLQAVNSWMLALDDAGYSSEGMRIYIIAGNKPVTFGREEITFANQETQWEYNGDWWVRIA